MGAEHNLCPRQRRFGRVGYHLIRDTLICEVAVSVLVKVNSIGSVKRIHFNGYLWKVLHNGPHKGYALLTDSV